MEKIENRGRVSVGARDVSSDQVRLRTPGRDARQAKRYPRPGDELATYWVAGNERLLICAAGDSGLEIHDVAADFVGASYRVERALDDHEALWAVVDDYLAQAERLGAPPMSSEGLAAVMLSSVD